jgi:hypothetical protein
MAKVKGGDIMAMITEDQRVQEFLRGMERLNKHDRNYIRSLVRSLFLVENPAPMAKPAGIPAETPETGGSGNYKSLRLDLKTRR